MAKRTKRADIVRPANLGSTDTGKLEEALEFVQRVKTATAEQTEKALEAYEGNTYFLPKPPSLRTSESRSSEGD